MKPIKSTLKSKSGATLAEWEGLSIPKNLKKSVRQALEMGGEVVQGYDEK